MTKSRQVACRRYKLLTTTYQSPALTGPIRAPFIITLPEDSQLCKHFEKPTFSGVTLQLPERPDIPTGLFTDHVLELAGELGGQPAAEVKDEGSGGEEREEAPPTPSDPDAIEHL